MKKLVIFNILIITLMTSFIIPKRVNIKNLMGIWVENDYNNGRIIYSKQNSFDVSKSGIEFRLGGKIVRRMSIGFCGTPPLTYKNFNGKWKLESDSTILINYKYSDNQIEREINYKINVISLSDNLMTIIEQNR
jgi:hypothetical protein